MPDQRDVPANSSPGGWRPQFTLRTLMASTLLFSFLFAVLAGLLRSGREDAGGPRMMLFVALAVAAPMVVMMAASLIGPVRRGLARWRRWRNGRRDRR